MAISKLDEKAFLNVDLEIFSGSNLSPLVSAFRRNVMVLYLAMEFGKHKAYLELAGYDKTPDSCIAKFCKLIQKLPPEPRRIWDRAEYRSFDIGFEAPKKGRFYWGAVSQEAVRAAAEVGARIAITVYGPMRVMKPVKKTARAKSTG